MQLSPGQSAEGMGMFQISFLTSLLLSVALTCLHNSLFSYGLDVPKVILH